MRTLWRLGLAAMVGCTVDAPSDGDQFDSSPGAGADVPNGGSADGESDGSDTGEPPGASEDDGVPGDAGEPGEPEPPATCDDAVRNGDESDVDCGGTDCDPCGEGAACGIADDCLSGDCDAGACGIATSCLAIKQARPAAKTGPYTIHPDGGPAAIDVWCDMDRGGGGWTLTFASDGPSFDVAHAVPQAGPASLPSLFQPSGGRFVQYAGHTEEMFVCTDGQGETPVYAVRTFEYEPRFWDQSLDNAEIFMTGTQRTPDVSATEYCADLVWGGCNLQHHGYAIFDGPFGAADLWGRWSGNTYYGPHGTTLHCYSAQDQSDNPDAWFWHFVR